MVPLLEYTFDGQLDVVGARDVAVVVPDGIAEVLLESPNVRSVDVETGDPPAAIEERASQVRADAPVRFGDDYDPGVFRSGRALGRPSR